MDDKAVAAQSEHTKEENIITPPSEQEQVQYDAQTEKKLIRRVDWRLLPILGALYSIALIDRVNVSNFSCAEKANMLISTPSDFSRTYLWYGRRSRPLGWRQIHNCTCALLVSQLLKYEGLRLMNLAQPAIHHLRASIQHRSA